MRNFKQLSDVSKIIASATAHIAAATLVDGEGETPGGKAEESGKDFWTTSVGKFKFCIEELPPALQFTYQLLKVLHPQN